MIYKRVGQFEFPMFDPELILDIPAPTVWAEEATVGEAPYLALYGIGAQAKVPWDKVILGFYVNDRKFAVIWNRFAVTLDKFKQRKIMGMITPNFSAFFDATKTYRLWQIYRSRAIGAAYQEAGIKIIPDISGHPDDIDFVYDGIPKNKPISMQVFKSLTEEELILKNRVIENTFRILEPSRVWVYGEKRRIDLFPLLKDSRVEWITPWEKVREVWRTKNKFNRQKAKER